MEEYILVKTYAYKCAKFFDELTMKKKLEFIENCIPYEKGSDFYRIFVHTLLIPNDMYFITQLITTKNYNELSKYYGLPLGIIVAKVLEIKKYELDTLLLNNRIDRELSSQKVEGINAIDDLEDILLAVFKQQDYNNREKKENKIIKDKIISYIK